MHRKAVWRKKRFRATFRFRRVSDSCSFGWSQALPWAQETTASGNVFVAATGKSTCSFAVTSDGMFYDCLCVFFQIEKFRMSTITMILFTHSHKGLAWGIEQRAIFENGCQLYEFRKPKYPAAKRMPSATNHGNNACDGAGEISKATSSSTQLLKANKKNNIKHTTFWVQCPSIRKVPWRCTSTKLN